MLSTLMFSKGDIVNMWHDTGAFGNYMVFGEVVRVNRTTITVRWQGGRVWRIEPQHLELVTGKFAQEVRIAYLSMPSNKASHPTRAG